MMEQPVLGDGAQANVAGKSGLADQNPYQFQWN